MLPTLNEFHLSILQASTTPLRDKRARMYLGPLEVQEVFDVIEATRAKLNEIERAASEEKLRLEGKPAEEPELKETVGNA